MVTGLIVNEMVELLCTNLQKDDLAAINASLSADGATASDKEALLKVSPTFVYFKPQLQWFHSCGWHVVADFLLQQGHLMSRKAEHGTLNICYKVYPGRVYTSGSLPSTLASEGICKNSSVSACEADMQTHHGRGVLRCLGCLFRSGLARWSMRCMGSRGRRRRRPSAQRPRSAQPSAQPSGRRCRRPRSGPTRKCGCWRRPSTNSRRCPTSPPVTASTCLAYCLSGTVKLLLIVYHRAGHGTRVVAARVPVVVISALGIGSDVRPCESRAQ